MSNHLRMPFAEWLFRMSEANVPYQARSLATYAVLFKVTANDELAKLSGMDTKGLADKTYNRWKRVLSDDGWVFVKSILISRTTTIDVSPAIAGTPVTFTDVKPRDPARFARSDTSVTAVETTGQSYGPEVEVTRQSYGPAVEMTAEPVKVTGELGSIVKVTDASRVRLVTPSGLVIPKNLKDNPPLSPTADADDEQRVSFEKGRLTIFNGLRQFWLEKFGGDSERLDLALTQAAGYVQPNSFKPLEAQVSAQLARMAAEKRDRDQRYERTAKRNAPRVTPEVLKEQNERLRREYGLDKED